MKIFLPVWGDKYHDYAERGLLKSLSWPSNARAIEGAEWIVATDRPEKFPGKTILPYNGSSKADFLKHALFQAIKICLRRREPMLMACPDFVFSDGSIETFKLYANSPGICVGMAHPRVLPKMLDDIAYLDRFTRHGAAQVKMAFQNLHRTWEQADLDRDRVNCFSTGVSWRERNGLILVQHRLPNPFLVNFVRSDLEYFRHNQFNAWDWKWPSTWQNRMRLIGSSDAAFVCEITDKNQNHPPLVEKNVVEPDAFSSDLSHYDNNRQFITVFRKG